MWQTVALAIATAGLTGCAVLGEALCGPNCAHAERSSSSLVEFLYSKGAEPPPENSIPELHVPLRVGLAFLPARGAAAPDPALREQLLERVRERFRDRRFVREIVIVPDYYLTAQRGFAGLEAVQHLYAIDLMALVSYDQVTHADDNSWSLGYLTIVGAYVLKGSRYDVATLVDLAVVDPATRSLVLRSGGVDTRHGNTTLIAAQRASRDASAAGFSAASEQMMNHFDGALNDFERDVQAGRANVRVVRRDGTAAAGGGGAFTWPWLMLLVPVTAAVAARRLKALQESARRIEPCAGAGK